MNSLVCSSRTCLLGVSSRTFIALAASCVSDSRTILTREYTQDSSMVLSESFGPWGGRLESLTSDEINDVHRGYSIVLTAISTLAERQELPTVAAVEHYLQTTLARNGVDEESVRMYRNFGTIQHVITAAVTRTSHKMRERSRAHQEMHAAAMAESQAPSPNDIEPFGMGYYNAPICLVHDEQTSFLREALVPAS